MVPLPSSSRIIKLEDKGELSASKHLSVQCYIEVLKEYDAEFCKSHFAIVELVDEAELVGEQAVLDDHSD